MEFAIQLEKNTGVKGIGHDWLGVHFRSILGSAGFPAREVANKV